jgi:hypothetical protein
MLGSLVDFNVTTPKNRTQSSNECGVVIHNNVTGCTASPRKEKDPGITYGKKRKSVNLGIPPPPEYPDLSHLPPDDSPAPSVTPRDLTYSPELQDEQVMYLNDKIVSLSKDLDLYKEIALTLSRILKDNNKKLLANIIDQSGKIIIDKVSLCTIIAKLIDVNVEFVHLEYVIHTEGCLGKIVSIADIQDIKINHIDFRLGYNEKYNILQSDFSISLKKVLI